MKIKKIVSTVSAHAEGEVGNVLVGGVIDVPGTTAFEKMEFLRDREDSLRGAILFEPRGSVCQAVNVLLPTSNPDADLAFVIMETTKYPVMSGSNTICVATVVLETGIRRMEEPETRLVLESPGGLVEAICQCRNGKVERVILRMLPSFVFKRSISIEVPGYGEVNMALAYGGIFFAIVPASSVSIKLDADSAKELVAAGIAIRAAVNRTLDVVHPENPKIRGVMNVTLTDNIKLGVKGIKETLSATVIGSGRLDRSPCGTGISARMALLHEEGDIVHNELLIYRSVFNTSFHGRTMGSCKVENFQAVLPEISGRSWITGFHQIIIDPGDPLADGHCPNDVWLTLG